MRLFGHFFDQREIYNPRSGEYGSLLPDEHDLLNLDWLELEEPETCLAKHDFNSIKEFGDAWRDGHKSLRNLIHQLHSLDRVAQAACDWDADLYVFARPDLMYHDSLKWPIVRLSRALDKNCVLLPRWQHFRGGFNDRFALATRVSGPTYGHRVHAMGDYVRQTRKQIHAESFLRFCLESSGVSTRFISTRASRVRSDGSMVGETFLGPTQLKIKLGILRWIKKRGL